MPDRKTYLELLHSDIAAHAKVFAQELFEGVSQGITEGIQQDADEFLLSFDNLPDIPPGDVEHIVIPAFTSQVFEALADLSRDAYVGWFNVFYTNLQERYENEGRIEP